MIQKQIQKFNKIQMPYGIHFRTGFGRFRDSKWKQVDAQTGAKIDVNFGAPVPQKIYKNH